MNFQGRRYLIADRDGAWAWMSAGSIVFELNVIFMYLSIIYLIVKLNNNIFREFSDLFSETKLIEIEDVCNGSSSCF